MNYKVQIHPPNLGRFKSKGNKKQDKAGQKQERAACKQDRAVKKQDRVTRKQERAAKKQQRAHKAGPKICAFDICSRGIKMVTLLLQDKPQIVECRELFVAANQVFFKSEIDQLLRRLTVLPQAEYLLAGVADEQVLVREIQVPELTGKELSAAVSFQAGELLLLHQDEMVVDYHVLNSGQTAGDGNQQILMAAIAREFSYQISSCFREKGCPLQALDTLALAAGRCLLKFHPGLSNQTAAVIDIGASVSHLTIYCQGQLKLIRSLNCGGNSINRVLAEQLMISPEEAEHYKLHITEDDIVAGESSPTANAMQNIWENIFEQGLTGAVLQVLNDFRERYPDLPLAKILLTGGGSQMAGLPAHLEAISGVKTERACCEVAVAENLRDILLTPQGYLRPEWTAAVGLACS